MRYLLWPQGNQLELGFASIEHLRCSTIRPALFGSVWIYLASRYEIRRGQGNIVVRLADGEAVTSFEGPGV